MKFLNAAAFCGALLLLSDARAGGDGGPGTIARADLETVTVVRLKDGQEVLRYTVPAVEFYGGPTPDLPLSEGAGEVTRVDEARVPTPAPPPTTGQTAPGDTVTTTRERGVPGDGRYRRTTTYSHRCNAAQACDWNRTENTIIQIQQFSSTWTP